MCRKLTSCWVKFIKDNLLWNQRFGQIVHFWIKIALVSNVYAIFSAIYHPRFKLMVCGESWHHAELNLLRLIYSDINSLATTRSDSPFLNQKIALANNVYAIFSAVYHLRVKIMVCAESWHHAESSLFWLIYCDINGLATTRSESPFSIKK